MPRNDPLEIGLLAAASLLDSFVGARSRRQEREQEHEMARLKYQDEARVRAKQIENYNSLIERRKAQTEREQKPKDLLLEAAGKLSAEDLPSAFLELNPRRQKHGDNWPALFAELYSELGGLKDVEFEEPPPDEFGGIDAQARALAAKKYEIQSKQIQQKRRGLGAAIYMAQVLSGSAAGQPPGEGGIRPRGGVQPGPGSTPSMAGEMTQPAAGPFSQGGPPPGGSPWMGGMFPGLQPQTVDPRVVASAEAERVRGAPQPGAMPVDKQSLGAFAYHMSIAANPLSDPMQQAMSWGILNQIAGVPIPEDVKMTLTGAGLGPGQIREMVDPMGSLGGLGGQQMQQPPAPPPPQGIIPGAPQKPPTTPEGEMARLVGNLKANVTTNTTNLPRNAVKMINGILTDIRKLVGSSQGTGKPTKFERFLGDRVSFQSSPAIVDGATRVLREINDWMEGKEPIDLEGMARRVAGLKSRAEVEAAERRAAEAKQIEDRKIEEKVDRQQSLRGAAEKIDATLPRLQERGGHEARIKMIEMFLRQGDLPGRRGPLDRFLESEARR